MRRFGRKFGSKFLTLLICGILCLTACPFQVFAEEQSDEEEVDYYAQAEERKNKEIQSNKTQGWPEGPAIGAEAAILMEAETGTILYAKNIHEHLYPASITKIMTGLLAYENLSMDDMVEFSETAVFSIEYGSASIGIDPGEALTVEQSLYALFVASANEVAAGLAEKMGVSLDKFPDMMNRRAKQLGCTDTHFTNANGLFNEEHYTSAYDMALISREFFSHEELAKIANSPTYFMESSDRQPEEFTLFNKHKLINGEIEYEGILGGKTGFVEMSRQTLVTCAERNDMRLICVILMEESPDQFNDTVELFDYGFNNFHKLRISDHEKKYTISNPGFMSLGKDIYGSNSIPFVVSNTGYVCIPKNIPFEELTSEVEYDDQKAEQAVKDTKENSAEGATSASAGEKAVIGKIKYKVDQWDVGETEILFTGTIPSSGETSSEGATNGMTGPAPEQEPEPYGTAHYSENKSFIDGIKYFFRGIFHSGANGTMYLDVPALLFLIIIVSSILIVVIFILSYLNYIRRRRKRARRRRRKQQNQRNQM